MSEFSELEQEMLQNMVQLYRIQNLCTNSWLSKLFKDRISLINISGDKPFQYKIIIKYDGLSENELILKIKYFHFLFLRLEKANYIKLDILGNNMFKFEELNFKDEYTLMANSINSILYNFLTCLGIVLC